MKRVIFSIVLTIGAFAYGQTSTNELNVYSPDDQTKSVVSGFYNRVNVGVLGGSASSRSFNIVNGYRFDEHWSVGLGLGIEEFYWNRYIPTFVEGNYNLLKSNTTPWVSLLVGYELPYQNIGSVRGGITAGGKIGFSYFVADHVGISTSVGYRYARLTDQSNWWGWEDYLTVTNINRFEFRVGLVFK